VKPLPSEDGELEQDCRHHSKRGAEATALSSSFLNCFCYFCFQSFVFSLPISPRLGVHLCSIELLVDPTDVHREAPTLLVVEQSNPPSCLMATGVCGNTQKAFLNTTRLTGEHVMNPYMTNGATAEALAFIFFGMALVITIIECKNCCKQMH